MKKSQLLAAIINYDYKNGWRRKHYGDAPVIDRLKQFLNASAYANAVNEVIPFSDFQVF